MTGRVPIRKGEEGICMKLGFHLKKYGNHEKNLLIDRPEFMSASSEHHRSLPSFNCISPRKFFSLRRVITNSIRSQAIHHTKEPNRNVPYAELANRLIDKTGCAKIIALVFNKGSKMFRH